MNSSLFFVLALFSSFVLATLALPPTEQSIKLPSDWILGHRADPTHKIQFHIGVKQQNKDELQRILEDVSSPSSPKYGKHLTFDQVNDLVAPSQESLSIVFNWLESNGITEYETNLNSDMIQFTATVNQAESLLSAAYHRVHHKETGKILLRAAYFSLPEEVADHIDFVGPTVRLPFHPHVRLLNDISPEANVDPTFLRKLYGVGSTVSKSPQNQLSVTAFLDQYYSPDDLAQFFQSYDPNSVGRTANLVGPNRPNNPGVEASLDIQYSMALGAGVNTTFWSTAGRAPNNKENEPFLAFLYIVSNSSDVPQIFSISYGDNEDTVDLSYADRISVEFQKGGARGITFLASSGDGGVAGSQSTSCTKFIPTFPAANPYVTAVGGTYGSDEVGISFSSGGFSNYWNPPSYQTSSISTYLKTASNLPSPSRYNASGAGFPDISAQSDGFLVVIGGTTSPVAGTSCSSPTVAGIVALLNDIRLQAGKSTLGWLNPLLYSHPEVLNDITSGNNPGCNTNGFYAAKGWDPITGLGTPNFPALANLVKSLP